MWFRLAIGQVTVMNDTAQASDTPSAPRERLRAAAASIAASPPHPDVIAGGTRIPAMRRLIGRSNRIPPGGKYCLI